MSEIANRLPAPNYNKPPDYWIEQPIWGHRFYDEQSPWLTFMEFLNIFCARLNEGCGLKETEGYNKLKYKIRKRLYLRNILFNFPMARYAEIRKNHKASADAWDKWKELALKGAAGIEHANFDYLLDRFDTFDDFVELVKVVYESSLEVESNKRWTSKFVYPFGVDCLFTDLDNKARSRDRRFFGRSGELLYQMLCRSTSAEQLERVFQQRFVDTDSLWNKVVRGLQIEDDSTDFLSADSSPYLPYETDPVFDALGRDWVNLLRLEHELFDCFPHLVSMVGLHIVRYILSKGSVEVGGSDSPYFVCEIVGSKKTTVRDLSIETYEHNNRLSSQAVNAYIDKIEETSEWQDEKGGPDAFANCKKLLEDKVWWPYDKYEGAREVEPMFEELRERALKTLKRHLGSVHRVYSREIGLVTRRVTNRLRYAPHDGLLRALVLTNVNKQQEYGEFLEKLYERYGLIFGHEEAEKAFGPDDIERKHFQDNSERLEHRLRGMGLLRRLSDGCAYVRNPYSKVENGAA